MIVDPDFLTHWKTQMLVVEMNDRAAPLYVIALWAHCQQRRTANLGTLPPNALKAICRYEGEASKLRSALERCGFLDAAGESMVVHGWAEANAKLVANWENGEKGGRPQGKRNPQKTHNKPNGNPNPNWGNPPGTDRVEESREERNNPLPPGENDSQSSLPLGAGGIKEGKPSSLLPTTEQSKRIAGIFHRRLNTPWTDKEVRAYKKLGIIPEEDLAAVEAYYAEHWPPNRDRNILRHDLLTFLNNFPGEAGRARQWAETQEAEDGEDDGYRDV